MAAMNNYFDQPWQYEQLMKQQEIEYLKRQRRAEYEAWLASQPAPNWYMNVPLNPIEPEWTPPKPEERRKGSMNYSTAVFLINNQVRAVTGIYEDGGSKATFKTLDKTIKKDDLVVVPTNTRHKMTVFKITETDVDVDMDSGTKMDWIVCKVDEPGYKKLLEHENEAIQKIKSAEMRKKREELKTALFKDQEESLNSLALAHDNGEVPQVEGLA